jgi:diguanylate cyclase (GGDEF)-like protein
MNDEDKTVIAKINIEELTPKKQDEDMVASLVQYSGKESGKRHYLNNTQIKIGRDSKCEIICNDASISRLHAEIIDDQEKKTTQIKDLESSNGTFVNDNKIVHDQHTTLKDQDMIRVGSILFKYFSHENVDGMVQDKVYKMATIDQGTKIFNKQYLMDSLQNHFLRAKKGKTPLSLIYFDLDHFKKVNDTYGHNAGDQILRDCAALIKDKLKDKGIFARFGGEEFIIILPKIDIKKAFVAAENIRKACATQIHKLEYSKDDKTQIADHTQTISIGVSQLSENMESPRELLEDADKKLYQSKEGGRNKVTM